MATKKSTAKTKTKVSRASQAKQVLKLTRDIQKLEREINNSKPVKALESLQRQRNRLAVSLIKRVSQS